MAKWDLSKLPEGRKPLPDEWFKERAQMQERIKGLEAKLAKAVEGERCAKIADKCQRENGLLSKKGFNEQYRRGLEAAGQAIAAAIRAELTGGKDG